VPNPQAGSILTLDVDLQGFADSLEIRVFSKAMTCVRDLQVEGNFGPGWNLARADLGSPLPLGLYYTLVKARRGAWTSQAQGPVKLMVIR
jgi:hypothetical protein